MKLELVPVATILVVIFAVVGGVVVITHPSSLGFHDYLKYMATAAAILGIGRGLDATHKP